MTPSRPPSQGPFSAVADAVRLQDVSLSLGDLFRHRRNSHRLPSQQGLPSLPARHRLVLRLAIMRKGIRLRLPDGEWIGVSAGKLSNFSAKCMLIGRLSMDVSHAELASPSTYPIPAPRETLAIPWSTTSRPTLYPPPGSQLRVCAHTRGQPTAGCNIK